MKVAQRLACFTSLFSEILLSNILMVAFWGECGVKRRELEKALRSGLYQSLEGVGQRCVEGKKKVK